MKKKLSSLGFDFQSPGIALDYLLKSYLANDENMSDENIFSFKYILATTPVVNINDEIKINLSKVLEQYYDEVIINIDTVGENIRNLKLDVKCFYDGKLVKCVLDTRLDIDEIERYVG